MENYENEGMSEVNIRLKALNEDIRVSWTKDEDKTNSMKEITTILEDINSKESLEDYFENNEKDIKYFSETFVKDIITNILSQSYVIGDEGDDIALELLFQIYRFFIVFHDKKYSSIFEEIIRIFKNNNKSSFFYPKEASYRNIPNQKKKYTFIQFNEKFCPNFVTHQKSEVCFNKGDKVDIMMTNKNYKNKFDRNDWIRGEVREIDSDYYYIKTYEVNDILIPIGSSIIKHEGEITTDWDWRMNLKKSDLVDVYSRDMWWPCTIVDVVEETGRDGFKRKKFKIGFRIYLQNLNDENNTNDDLENFFFFWSDKNLYTDNKGEDYFGDNETKDEEIFHFSKRIQKFNTFSKKYREAKMSNDIDYINKANEELLKKDIIGGIQDQNFLYKKDNIKNIIIGKSGKFSYYFAWLLKKMEQEGDFEEFIKILENKPNSDEIINIFNILLSSMDYIHIDYFEENKKIFKDSFMNYINNLDDQYLRNIPTNIIEIGTNFLKIIFNNNIEEEINLNISLKMITSTLFDKRSQGIKTLNEYIRKNESNKDELLKVCELIKKNNIIGDIFGSNYHSQIISKTNIILKLLLKNNKLNEEEIKNIWSCTQRGELETKLIIIKLLTDLSKNFDESFIGLLLEWIVELADKKPYEQEIEFISKLSSLIKSDDNINKISNYFCKSLLRLDTFKNKEPVFVKLLQLMTKNDAYLFKVLEICEKYIKENNRTLICYSMIIALFEKYIKDVNQNQETPYKCEKEKLKEFLENEHLLKIFEENFAAYNTIAKEKIKSLNKKEYSLLVIDGFNHQKNVDGRLAFLSKLVNTIYPDYDFIDKLKGLLLDNPVFPEDRQYFYKFLKQYCFPLNQEHLKMSVRDQAKIKLYKIFIEEEQREMTYNEFILFIDVFLFFNSSHLSYKKVIKNEEEEYKIKLKPNSQYDDIQGVEELWKIIYKEKDEKIINKLINIINQVVEAKKIISILCDKYNNEEEESEIIQTSFKLIKQILIEFEKNMVIDIKSHYSLSKNCIIKFNLKLKNVQNNKNNIIELFYDNTTLNDIKEILMKKYNIPMQYIEAYIIKNKEEFSLDYKYNNQSLKEIVNEKLGPNNEKKIKYDEVIIFSKKEEKENLLIEDEELSPKFKKILKEWFNNFTNGTGKMDKKCCAKFISKVTNNPNINENDERVKVIFKKYDKNENGFLTEEIFYQSYLDSIKEGNINEAWKNLENMGYDEFLNKKGESFEPVHTKTDVLFRHILNVEDFLKEFIYCYNNYSEINYDFLLFMPTNKDIYDRILYQLNNDSELSSKLFKSNEKESLMQLYEFIIIESFLQDIELNNINPKNIFNNKNNSLVEFGSRKYEPFDSYNINDKIKFLEDFIKNQNYQKLINYYINILNNYMKNKNEVVKMCCIKSIKIIEIIYEACLDNIPENKQLIDDYKYYLDYSHICNELKNKNDIRQIVLNLSYSNLFNSLNKYLLKKKKKNDDFYEEELYNYNFDFIVKLLAFNEKVFSEFISDENVKKSLIDLIKNGLISNYSSIINSLTNVMKRIPPDSNNQFILLISDLIETMVGSTSSDESKKIFLSKDFFDFFIQINEAMSNSKKDENKKLSLNIIKMLINDINEPDKNKKISNEIFTKYIKLIIELIDKNPKIIDEVISFKINDESLITAIIEKVLYNNDKDDNEIKIQKINNENEFISLDKIDEDNNKSLDEQLNDSCRDLILKCLNDIDNQMVIKGIIKMNRMIKENKEKILYDTINKRNNEAHDKKQLQATALKACGHVGLYNLGSICYMNSILQQLYMVPTFRYAIMGLNDNIIPKSSIEKYSPNDDNFLHQLQVMYTFLTISEKQFYNPEPFCNSFKDSNGKPINPKVQQDSQEFYNNFCEKLEQHLKNTKYKYIINDTFMGKACSTVECKTCHHISYKYEDFYNLTLEVSNINNLNDSLQKSIISEIIDDFKCYNCNSKVSIQKRTTLCKLPNTLIIHLKRFYMNYEIDRTEKINSRFDFPMKINLKSFCVETFQKHDESEQEIYFKNDEYYEYILKGVNVHLGHANSGHYFSYIDVERDGKGNNMKAWKPKEKLKWVKFNDTTLSEYNPEDIPKDCFGGTHNNKNKNVSYENSQNAYLLIYERVKKTPIKVLIEEKNISEQDKKNMVVFKNEEVNSINKQYDLSRLNNNINEEDLYNKIFYNKEINEYYKYIPYYNIPKCAPKSVYNHIMESNNSVKGITSNNNNKENIEYQQGLLDKLYNIISSKIINDKILSYQANEQNDIINITTFDIFQAIKKPNLTEKEKKDINYKLNILLVNVIKPLINDNTNIGVLENIQRVFISRERVELIFLNDERIFDEKNVILLYETIKELIEMFKIKNKFQCNSLFEILFNYLNNKLKSEEKRNDKNNTIKYLYNLIKNLIDSSKELARNCARDNLIFILMNNLEKDHESNHAIIFQILKIIIKATRDYNKNLFYIKEEKNVDDNNDNNNNEVDFKDKNKIKNYLSIPIIEKIFDKDNELLVMLIKILEYKDKSFTDKLNLEYLPSLFKFSKSKGKLFRFIELCIHIIDIKDDLCIERMKQLLGYPTLIIRPVTEESGQRWPLFGAQLIKNNNNDLKTEIYKYICFNKKQKFCILSYLLPCTSEINSKNNIDFPEDNIDTLIYELLLKIFTKNSNYCIFKYLYLLPARSLFYKNAYEELITVITRKPFDLSETKNIENLFIEKIDYDFKVVNNETKLDLSQNNDNPKKPNFTKEMLEYNKDIKMVNDFIGFIPDYIPGEIVKIEVQSLVNAKTLELIRIEYFTKYYNIDEFKKSMNETKDVNNNITNENIYTNETVDEKEKTLKVDISNEEYQREEKRFFEIISKKLEKVEKIIINDGILDEDKTINTLIRYILINKKSIDNEIRANIKLIKGLKNNCIPQLVCGYVDKHNYVDVLDINRIKMDELLLKKDEIFININSGAYLKDK